MRKQYNFWPGEDGLHAWDVDRLIELSRDLPVVQVALSDITEVDTAYWAEPGAPPATVRDLIGHIRLIEAADPGYPIILASDGRVMDGMHRVAKALLAGQETIRAVRFVEQPPPDFRGVDPDHLPYDDQP